jgi:hypothetical protein
VGFLTRFFNDSNIEQIIIQFIGGWGIPVILTGIAMLALYFIRKKFWPKRPEVIPTVPSDQASYLNRPKEEPLNDIICTEREELSNKVFNAIKGKEGDPSPFVKNHVAIIGGEGIGKTYFCKNLYFNFLEYSKIYLVWIECEGHRSIYDIIKENFDKSRFKVKNKDALLETIKGLDRPCVLFIDQVDRHTSSAEIQELMACPNTSIVVSGLLKRKDIKFIDESSHFSLGQISRKTTRTFFEVQTGEDIDDMDDRKEKSAVNFIIDEYIRGNPFLVNAYAGAKALYGNSWVKVKENMSTSEYDKESDDYIKSLLKKLYKIADLDGEERKTLSKLCVFSSMQYTEEVFEFSNIPLECVKGLCRTYWLTQSNVFYYLDEVHKKVLEKVLGYSDNLRELIVSLTSYIQTWKVDENKGFDQIAPYAEDILNKVKIYTPQFMDDPDIFADFAYLIAHKYYVATRNYEKSREWLGYCNPIGIFLPEDHVFLVYKELQKKDQEMSDSPSDIFESSPYFSETSATYDNIKQKLMELRKKEGVSKIQLGMLYKKDVLDFHLKMSLPNDSPGKSREVEQAYSIALSRAEKLDDLSEVQKYLKEEYCFFLNNTGKYDEVKSLCKEHFDIFGFALDDKYSCDLYHRYLTAAYASDDEELIESLISGENLDALWNNRELSITVAGSFGVLYYIFNKKGNDKIAELCKRRMVILINHKKNFFHSDIKSYIELSDEEFIEYMHSHEELVASLDEAIDRGDADALYLEGRYQEKSGDFNEAFALYERSAKKDNLKGICSLALMYYRGPEYYRGLEEPQGVAKAREYWEYCIEGGREHRGSHYWLGIMLLDENYEGCNKELAIQHLIKAAEMGSKRAMEKLLEMTVPSTSESIGA